MVSDPYDVLGYPKASDVETRVKAARKPGRCRAVRVASLGMLSVLLLASTAAMAVAANFVGTGGPDRIVGSPWADLIDGRGGNDRIAGGGEDRIRGGFGDDLIKANDDRHRDYVDCGPGFDVVTVDPQSNAPRDVYSNCEFRRPSG